MTTVQSRFLPRQFLTAWHWDDNSWYGDELVENWPDGFQIRDVAGATARW